MISSLHKKERKKERKVRAIYEMAKNRDQQISLQKKKKKKKKKHSVQCFACKLTLNCQIE